MTSVTLALSVLYTSVSLVELWAGCCSLASPMEAMALPGHDVALMAFSEVVPQARQYSSTLFPHALDLGPYTDAMHELLQTTPDVVSVSFDCAPYVICGRQKMHRDKRAQQIPQTIDFILKVAPHLVWNEQAQEFYANDPAHGLLTEMNTRLHATMASYPVHFMYDPQYGGYLHRTRGFKVWESWQAYYTLPPLQQPAPCSNAQHSLVEVLDPVELVDPSLRVRGTFVPCATTDDKGQLPTVVGHILVVPGDTWQVGDELQLNSTLYRIDKISHSSVRMFPQTRWNPRRDTNPIEVHPSKLRPQMARSHKEAVFSILTLCKSPRGWGEHQAGNIAIYLDIRMDPPVPRILSAREKVKIMRQATLPGGHVNYAQRTIEIMDECGIPPQHVTKLMGRSITAAMAIPWAQILVDRSRLWQTCCQLQWHQQVPLMHAQAPSQHKCRMLLLVATLLPVPMVLVSSSIDLHQFCPAQDFDAPKCNQDIIDVAAQWCTHMHIDTQPFPAGSTYGDSPIVIAMAAPVPHADALDMAGITARLKPSWQQPQCLTEGHLKFAAQIVIAKMRMFAGPSPALAEVLCNPFKSGKTDLVMLRTTRVAEHASTIPFEDAVRVSMQADHTLRQLLQDPMTMVEFEHDKSKCLEMSNYTISEYAEWGSPSDWASRIELMDMSDIPLHMQVETPIFDDPELETLLFCDKCCPPSTKWLPLTPNQTADAAWLSTLSTRSDLYLPTPTVVQQEQWLQNQGEQCSDYHVNGGDSTRWHNHTQVFAERHRHPNARGKIFDTGTPNKVTLVRQHPTLGHAATSRKVKAKKLPAAKAPKRKTGEVQIQVQAGEQKASDALGIALPKHTRLPKPRSMEEIDELVWSEASKTAQTRHSCQHSLKKPNHGKSTTHTCVM